MSISPLLDLTRAKEFAVQDDQLIELVVTFETSLVNEMGIIQSALASGDALKVEHALHALKGFMALFAVAPMAQSIADLYQTSRQAPLAMTGAAFTALVPNLEQLLAEVRAYLRAL
jgi:HPt (histidine-containing phosphotransfer) domain-containing protein